MIEILKTVKKKLVSKYLKEDNSKKKDLILELKPELEKINKF